MFSRKAQDGLDELRRIVFRCDICVVDLDECICPRFTQTTLGALILARSFRPQNARLLPRLLMGAAYISVVRFLQLFGCRPANIDLMHNFSKTMDGVPMAMVEECAAKLPSMAPREWRKALAAVASRMPVYLLTFSIEPLARAYARVDDCHGKAIFSGYRGTPIDARNSVFRKCLFGKDSFTPEAKERALSRILVEANRRRPLVIGHGRDEAAMFRMAGEMGGGSIAIHRRGTPDAEFSVPVHRATWRAISESLADNRKK